ncbi:MAG: glutamate--tRNA ligase [Candidatus Anstonellaceae archaeon]
MAPLKEIIRKHTLKNAYDHGQAIPSKVIGKVLGEWPQAKEDLKATMKMIEEETARVNALSKEQIEEELAQFSFEEKVEQKKELTLPEAKQGQVVTRFPPEPSGYPHIGHAKAAWLDFECAMKYEGKMILRFDDTNPEKEKQEFVDAIKEGLSWLGIRWHMETYTSDYMELLYGYAEKLLETRKAYVCSCSPQEIKKGREAGQECACRGRTANENLRLFEQMKIGDLEEGAAIVRFMGDMKSENTVMRDPTLLRIVKTSHYRQKTKYCCWPSYDFSAPILDSVEGVTHAMRTKEYELRDALYFAILEALALRKPHMIEFARLEIKNAPVSKRLILPLVQEGKVDGFSDPRLPTLAGLKRRGILPEAIKEFVLEFGLSKVESKPGYDKLLWYNRKYLDNKAIRRFFVPAPVRLVVEGATPQGVSLRNHPNLDLGKRTMIAGKEFYIAGQDASSIAEGEVFRLKELYNVKLVSKTKDGLLASFVSQEGAVEKKIQWVPAEGAVSCTVYKPGKLLDENGQFNPKSMLQEEGYCEPSCINLAEGSVVQFERYGYCRLDRKEASNLVFIFSC